MKDLTRQLLSASRESLLKMLIETVACITAGDDVVKAAAAFLSAPRGANDDRELRRALDVYEKNPLVVKRKQFGDSESNGGRGHG